MTDHTGDLLTLIQQAFPSYLPYTVNAYDAEATAEDLDGLDTQTQITPTDPHVLVYGGAQAVENRRYHNGSRNRGAVWRAMVVSSSASGARAMQRAITDAVDNTLLGGSRLTCHFPSEPIWDREDPTEWKWSATVEIHHHT